MTPGKNGKAQNHGTSTATHFRTVVTKSPAKTWRTRLITNRWGTQLPVVANALIALRYAPEWRDVLHFDESSFNTVAKRRVPWEDKRPLPILWTDEDDVRVAEWLQHEGILATKETAAQAVQTVAREHPYHPIRDYLDSLKWDGTKRIDDWLALYLGADSSDYTRAVGAKWLIGAVARIYKPGCKNDTCLILEGEQGTLKSTALRTLTEPWFTDDMPELGTKDAALQTRGVWLIELSELDAISKPEVARVKAFMSRPTDRFRPPFGRRPIVAPRECVFAGTSNHGNYLKDETGGRRFWPVKCGFINIADLRRDRDQLWAEAGHRYRSGENWWLNDNALVAAAKDEQQQRYEGDPWDDKIMKWCEGRQNVTVTEVLEDAIDMPMSMWTQAHQNRVARTLASNGWRRRQRRCEEDRKRREWVYVSPEVTALDDQQVTE